MLQDEASIHHNMDVEEALNREGTFEEVVVHQADSNTQDLPMDAEEGHTCASHWLVSLVRDASCEGDTSFLAFTDITNPSNVRLVQEICAHPSSSEGEYLYMELQIHYLLHYVVMVDHFYFHKGMNRSQLFSFLHSSLPLCPPQM